MIEPLTPSPDIDRQDLSLRGVRLRYGEHGTWMLDGVDFDLPQGCRIALVGASGAGKSRLVAALTRLYPYQGSIALGGTPIDAWHGDDVRATIAVVEQRTYPFDTSLRDNLRLAPPGACRAEIGKVIGHAQLAEFVASAAGAAHMGGRKRLPCFRW